MQRRGFLRDYPQRAQSWISQKAHLWLSGWELPQGSPQFSGYPKEGNERRCLLEGTRPCASLFSVAALFDGCWHPRARHEGLRYLIEQLPRILFFAQRRCEKLDYLGLTHLHG